jgi:hypothetical protein
MGQARTQSLDWATWFPVARRVGLTTSEVGGEVLVYDQTSHHVHHLNRSSAAIWKQCDGRTAVTSIAASLGLSIDTVQVALGSLARANLLEGSVPSSLAAPIQSRRSFLRKAAIAGGVALPTIVSITAPQAAAAYSEGSQECIGASLFPLETTCNMDAQCCSEFCDAPFMGAQGVCATRPV